MLFVRWKLLPIPSALRPFGLPCLLVVVSVSLTFFALRWAWAAADRVQNSARCVGAQETF